MADDTTDTDWLDCHAVRRDEEARGRRERESHSGKRLGAITLRTARCTTLRLLEPDGSETVVTIEAAGAGTKDAARIEAAEAKAAAKALEDEKARAAEAAEAKAKAQAEKQARLAAEEEARKAAEAQKAEAERKAKEEAERKAKAEAEEKAKKEAEEKAQREAEEKARREAEAKAKKEAEEKAKREAEEKARKAAEEKARLEAEELARKKAEAKAKAEAEAKSKKEAEERARREAEEKARKEAEERARREAEEKARKEAEEKARREAEAKAKKEAEEKARREAEEKARKEAEAKAKAEAERKAKEEAERKAKEEAERKAREEAERKAKAEAERKAKEEAKAKAKAEAEAKAKAEAEEKARIAAEKAAEKKAEEEARAKAADLGKTFRRLIRETGPISLAHYMAESNARYYTSRDPLGEDADFITAPEVSQMFGELIGLWLADLWVRMGARKHIHYVELGPGRGTLASDALRTAGRYDFDPKIHFVETSPALRKLQLEAFPGAFHHNDLSTLPDDAPLLIVANEFFDALPVHQLVRSADGWHERMVGLEGDDFTFVPGSTPMDEIVPRSWKNASQGTMIETSAAASAVMSEISTRLKEQGGAALIIDYGSFELRSGSTLQAIKSHEKVDVFAHPGQADLTAHVDFEMLSDIAQKSGADVMGLQMQGDWLRQMGIETRLEALQRKNPHEKDKLKRQVDRLIDDGQMGTLFKVLGVCGRRWPIGVGFD